MNRETAQKRAYDLVAQMTVEEAAAQLKYNAPAIPRLNIPEYNWWNEALHGVARAGTATVFPQAIGMAAMFDDEFQKEIADTIATEGRAKYNMQAENGDRDIYKGLTFWSPNINIFRDPRWGRGHETYGEDPYLTTRLGVAFVNGLQGDGKYLKSAACAKHFAVHSGPEALRHEFDAVAGPKDMAETYLPAFEALVKEANVESVMGAYNRVNGEPACGSKTLLKDILREKWGFQGHVVSDCWAIADFHMYHKVTDTAPESAALALENGCDLNCGNTYLHMLTALQEGLVTEGQIRLAAQRLFTTRIMLGMFDADCEYDNISYLENDTDANDKMALEVAEKSMVLLKNDGVLPLDLQALKTVAVIGPNADSIPALEGNYAGTASRYVTFLEGIKAACKGTARVMYSQGCHLYKNRTSNLAKPENLLAEAVGAAKVADVVILCLGLDATIEGEQGDTGNEYSSGDKNTLDLPPSQLKLIEAVLKTGKPVISVVASGSALKIDQGNAVIQAWYPGQAGGTALANILFGKVSPSGKLPVTFYHSIDELPDFCDYSMKNRTYRYFEGKALYPFGFGLTYAKVAMTAAKAKTKADGAEVTVKVKNQGKIDTDEVIQIYIKDEESAFAPLHPSLCAFKRVHLKAGEERAFTLPIGYQAFTVIDDDGSRVMDGKKFSLYAGLNQPDALSEKLTGQKCIKMEIAL